MEKYFSSQQDDEEVIMIIRKHWIHFLPNVLIAVVVYLIGFFLILGLPIIAPAVISGLAYNIYVLLVSILFLFNTTNLFSAWLMHYLNVGLITSEHIVEICQDNLFSRKVSELGLDKIQDVSAQVKGVSESMFNYGTINVQTAGELPNFLFTHVPDPNETTQKIMEIEEDYCHRHNLRQMNGSETNRQAEKLVPENVDNSPQIEYPNQ